MVLERMGWTRKSVEKLRPPNHYCVMELVHTRADKFTISDVHIQEDETALVSVIAHVGIEGMSTDERVHVVAKVPRTVETTLAQIELEGLNRAGAILQAAAVQLSDQIHV